MLVNARSFASMMESCSRMLGMGYFELYDSLQILVNRCHEGVRWDCDRLKSEIESLLSERAPDIYEPLGTIQLFHLGWRFPHDSKNANNLPELLSGETEMTRFIGSHKIAIELGDTFVSIRKNGKEVSLKNDSGRYLKRRLGYAEDIDPCVNGFAFCDLLEKHFYTRYLSKGPEFLQKIADLLQEPELLQDFRSNASFYLFEYWIDIADILIDGDDRLSLIEKKRQYIAKSLLWLAWRTAASPCDDLNPILRLEDDRMASANQCQNVFSVVLDELPHGFRFEPQFHQAPSKPSERLICG